MKTARVAVSISKYTLKRLDRRAEQQVFPNGSRVIQEAI